MLQPNKHSHPDQTVLAASTLLLRELRRYRVIEYDDLKKTLAKRVEGAEYLFAPSVGFLHLLGLVEYRPVVDSFEYVGQ